MEKIFETQIRLTPADNRTHVKVVFRVPEGLRQLRIRTAYTPKYLEDETQAMRLLRACFAHCAPEQNFDERQTRLNLPLRNHIAWSIDTPHGLVGTEHRHNPDQLHTIGPTFASSGMTPVPIEAGEWAVTASINALVTDIVTVTIEAEGLR